MNKFIQKFIKSIYNFFITKAVVMLALVLILGFVSAKEIRIGAILSVSGPASFLGDPELKTLRYLVEEQNRQGGINGAEIKFIYYDSEGNPRKALTFAKRLIANDKVDVIVGPSTTGETLAIAKTIARAKIPLVSLAGASLVTSPLKEYIFATPPTDKMVCKKLFTYFQSQGFKRIAIISGTGGFGKAMRSQCLDLAKGYGLDVVVDVTYNPKDTDMSVQLNRIKNTSKVDAIINAGFGQSPTTVTKNYSELRIKAPLFQSHGVASNEFIKIAGRAAEGVYVVGPPLLVVDKLSNDFPTKAVSLKYKEDYERIYNEPVSSFGAYAYDAFSLIKNALSITEKNDAQSIKNGLERIRNLVSPSGVYNVSQNDHLGLDEETSFLILRIENQDWTIIK